MPSQVSHVGWQVIVAEQVFTEGLYSGYSGLQVRQLSELIPSQVAQVIWQMIGS